MSPAGAEPASRKASDLGSMQLGHEGAVVSEREAEALVGNHWAIAGTAHSIAAEVDLNFRIASPSGTYLLKVVPADEKEELTDLVTAALLHVEAVSAVAAPRVVRTTEGAAFARFIDANGTERRARMTTFLEGQILRSVRLDGDLRRRLGNTLAELAMALRDFDHPGADRNLNWDLRHADRMRAMQSELRQDEQRTALDECLARFESVTAALIDKLPRQIVHNDLSRDNAVLAADGTVGVIDFGDLVRTQRVNDLAIAMADHLDDETERLGAALDVAAGYVEVQALEDDEIAVLYDLVRTRVATRIIGGEWRAIQFPENREYLTRNVTRLRRVFARMPETPATADTRLIRSLGRGARR